jgi:heat shock protein HtpX
MPLNTMRTAVLLAAMTALFVLVGGALAGRGGAIVALAIAALANLFAWWRSDRVALASVDAREVDAAAAPELVGLVGDLARRAGLPAPRVYLVDSDQPNAFATGRDHDHAAIAVHTGLVHALTREELAGVLAHELAHVRNRDTLTMTITATLAGAISSIAHWGVFFGGRRDNGPGILGSLLISILAPLAAMVVQLAVSRGREYEADRLGALICGNPLWLARALVKISAGVRSVGDAHAEAHPAMAHMYVCNPLDGHGMDDLFSTHPRVENRVAALELMAREMGIAEGTAPPGGWSPFRDDAAASGKWGMRSRGPWG